MTLPDGTVIAADDCPRPEVTLDGVAALIVTSDTKARDLGLTPLARIVSTGVTGLSPELMGYGPVEASRASGPGIGAAIAWGQLSR